MAKRSPGSGGGSGTIFIVSRFAHVAVRCYYIKSWQHPLSHKLSLYASVSLTVTAKTTAFLSHPPQSHNKHHLTENNTRPPNNTTATHCVHFVYMYIEIATRYSQFHVFLYHTFLFEYTL